MKPSASLDHWRELFRRADSDIFQIIDHAIMVAAADSPNRFKSRRDGIAELLFSCRVARCSGCDHVELSVPGGDTAVDDGGSKENSSSRGDNNNQIVGNCSYEDDDEEAEALSDAVEEVVRIKEILLNRDDQPHSVILESLRKLKLMSLNVDILKSTEIGKAVNGLRKHSSDQIRQLAKTLIAEWKELVDQWVNTTAKDIAGAGGTPESTNPSVVDEEGEGEEEAFPSLPYDVDIFTPEANGFEILNGDFFDSLDFDGNLCNSEEYNTSREPERRRRRTQKRIEDAPFKPSSSSADVTRRPLKHEEKPLATEHKRKAPGPRQQKLKGGLDADAKFEFAKRKLQESYQHHENAKKQRTIQVLETIPKQGSVAAQKPQLKRPGMNNRNWAKRG